MNQVAQYEQIASSETRREAVSLVAQMMRYRVDTITGLEEEFAELLQSIRAPGNRRQFRRRAKRIILLANRIQQLAQDSQFDAIHLAAILRYRQGTESSAPGEAEDDPLRYIS